MRAGDCIGAQDELEIRRGDRLLDHRRVDGESLFHVGKAFFVVVADSEELCLVAEIVL